jgi:CubicO group peptidase (beta-lactamase class C family)
MMRRMQRYHYLPILLFCISSPVFVCLVLAQEKASPAVRPTVDYSRFIARLKERLPEYMTQYNVPGLAIALVDGDKLVWAEGFGFTDSTNQTKVTADTLFGVQSISKTYTATGFLIAVERGLLMIDDPLKKNYTQFTVNSRLGADEANKITFRHLLSHHSGLTHIAPCGKHFYDSPCPFADHIRSISETWLMFPVGERFSYSNLGIDLVGYALEICSGKPFDEFMNDELFRPLGMTSSTFNYKVVASYPSVAKGYTTTLMIPDRGRYTSLPSGGMYSTVKDMAKYISFHLAGGKIGGKQLIGENLLKEMYTPQFPIEGQVGGYGLGISREPLQSGTLLQHDGGGGGYSTAQMWSSEYQVGLVVLTNSESVLPYGMRGVLNGMIAVKYGPLPQVEPRKFTDKPIITVDTKSLQRLVGTYKLRDEMLVTFKVKGDSLYKVSGTTEVKLNAHSPTEFTVVGGKYTFILDERGRPKCVQVLGSYGVELWPFNDSPYEEAGPNKKEWQDFVGEYSRKADSETFNVSVMVKNGYLYLDMKDWGCFKLMEYKSGIFFAADGKSVIFHSDRMSLFNYGYTKKSTKTSLYIPQSPTRLTADKYSHRGE